MCAINEGIDRVIFAGNFLRKNSVSMSMLARAMDFWSKGTMKAIFLEHEVMFSILQGHRFSLWSLGAILYGV